MTCALTTFNEFDSAGSRVRRQRGAATLIVVMVLFFLMSMVAAYTNRNLIFEQRTSANQYRSTQALEAAEAGLQWALGLLNSGRIDAQCMPSTNLANDTFRQRYLAIDGPTGNLTPKLTALGETLLPSCVFDGTNNWQCSCPVNGAPALTAPAGSGVSPGYRVRFVTNALRPTLVKIEVNSCTRYHDDCLNFPAAGLDSEGRASVSALLALKGAVSTEPVATLTIHKSLVAPIPPLNIYNTNPLWSGVTVQAGGTGNDPVLTKKSIPGSPVELSVIENDPTLQFTGYTAADRPDAMFSGTFGMRRNVYRDQPGALVLACGGGTCTANDVRTAIALNPGRVIWAQGNVDFDSIGDVGSAIEPVAIVVTGNVVFSSALTIYGLIYTAAPNWVSSGSTTTLIGAMVAEGDVSGTSGATLSYDRTILSLLRTQAGSFVMVPGSWKDFP